ncbi:MAG: SRPBCC family protein [Bryobacteraceae bacterium]
MGWAKRIVLAFAAVVLLFAAILWFAGMRAGAGRNEIVVEIDRPPSDVFPWLLEPSKLKQWITGMREMTQLTPGAVGVGTKSRDVIVMGSEATVMTVEITKLEPNRLLAAHIDAGSFTDEIRYDLYPEGDKTRLAYSSLTTYKHWFARLLEPLITPAAQRKLVEDTRTLKAIVQSQR